MGFSFHTTATNVPTRLAAVAAPCLLVVCTSCGSDDAGGDGSGGAGAAGSGGAPCVGGFQELPITPDGTYSSQDGKADLSVSGNMRVLKLRGGPSEMGYNMGNLLAAEMLNFYQQFVLWRMTEQNADFDEIAELLDRVQWPQDLIDEYQGIVDGMADTLTECERTVYPPGASPRLFSLDDLKVAFTISEWSDIFGCSTVVEWGSFRSDGSSIVAKNSDIGVDPSGAIKRYQVIVSRDDGANNRWVTVGINEGVRINEHGLFIGTNATNGYPATETDQISPRGIPHRQIVKTATAGYTPLDVEAVMDAARSFQGQNTTICFPATGRTSDEIAAIVEHDGDAAHADGRATLRLPSDNGSLPADASVDQSLPTTEAIAATNHYLKRNPAIPDPAGSTSLRYQTIKDDLAQQAAGGNHVGVEDARLVMKEVGASQTVATVIFEPDSMQLHVWFAVGDDGAFESQQYDYSFDELF